MDRYIEKVSFGTFRVGGVRPLPDWELTFLKCNAGRHLHETTNAYRPGPIEALRAWFSLGRWWLRQTDAPINGILFGLACYPPAH
jgi:hypothetical protein